MSFTTIINGEGDAMRQLEKKTATTKRATKTPAKRSTKPGEAQLVLANGEMGEAARLGLSLAGAGVTAMTFGVLEGLARKGKAKWWRDLSPKKRGLALMAFVIVAGMLARHRRKGGHIKSATALESACVAAWTLAVAAFVESGYSEEEGKIGELYRREVGDLGVDELKSLDSEIDGDIQSAARRLRELAQEERTVRREERAMQEEEEDEEDLGALAYEGVPIYEEDDDDIY